MIMKTSEQTRKYGKRLIEPFNDDGRTIQSQQSATDINQLLKHYFKTGTFTHVAHEVPSYGDFSNAKDFLSCMVQVKETERLFMECSSAVRVRFEHDPAQMLEFLADPANEREAIELGLMPKPDGWRPEPESHSTPSSPPEAEEAESPVQGGE